MSRERGDRRGISSHREAHRLGRTPTPTLIRTLEGSMGLRRGGSGGIRACGSCRPRTGTAVGSSLPHKRQSRAAMVQRPPRVLGQDSLGKRAAITSTPRGNGMPSLWSGACCLQRSDFRRDPPGQHPFAPRPDPSALTPCWASLQDATSRGPRSDGSRRLAGVASRDALARTRTRRGRGTTPGGAGRTRAHLWRPVHPRHRACRQRGASPCEPAAPCGGGGSGRKWGW